MREIKFRARTTDSDTEDGWAYSDTHGLHDFFYGIDDGRYDEETLGQFTGLLDKNGTEIYEGDIIQDNNIDRNDGEKEDPYVVEWIDASSDIECAMVGLYTGWIERGDIEVIGNIYENKDLLK